MPRLVLLRPTGEVIRHDHLNDLVPDTPLRRRSGFSAMASEIDQDWIVLLDTKVLDHVIEGIFDGMAGRILVLKAADMIFRRTEIIANKGENVVSISASTRKIVDFFVFIDVNADNERKERALTACTDDYQFF